MGPSINFNEVAPKKSKAELRREKEKAAAEEARRKEAERKARTEARFAERMAKNAVCDFFLFSSPSPQERNDFSIS